MTFRLFVQSWFACVLMHSRCKLWRPGWGRKSTHGFGKGAEFAPSVNAISSGHVSFVERWKPQGRHSSEHSQKGCTVKSSETPFCINVLFLMSSECYNPLGTSLGNLLLFLMTLKIWSIQCKSWLRRYRKLYFTVLCHQKHGTWTHCLKQIIRVLFHTCNFRDGHLRIH